MPLRTLEAFADHGVAPETTMTADRSAAQVLDEAAAAGVDLSGLSAELEREGVQAFCASYRDLLARVDFKARRTP